MATSRWHARSLVLVALLLATGTLGVPKPIEALSLDVEPELRPHWLFQRQQDSTSTVGQATEDSTAPATQASTSSENAEDVRVGSATSVATSTTTRASTIVSSSSEKAETSVTSRQQSVSTRTSTIPSAFSTNSPATARSASTSATIPTRTITSSSSAVASSLSVPSSGISESDAGSSSAPSNTTTVVTSTNTPVVSSSSSTESDDSAGTITSTSFHNSATTTAPAANTTTTQTSTSAPATSTTSTRPTGTCACGYSVSRFNDMYVRNHLGINFKQSSASALSSAGIIIADGFQIGSTATDGTSCITRSSNVRFTSEGVQLVFPGNQTTGGRTEGAELIFNNQGRGMTRMFIEAVMQVDNTPGTCQALFTFTSNPDASKDEQDMEVIAASLLEASPVKEAGLQLTNHDPSGNGERGHNTVPFPSDPSIAFHKYSMAWDSKSVQYYFDDQLLDGPNDHVSTNPSVVVLNHWGTGEIGFFGAPLPTETVIMTVSSLSVYYETANQSDLPAGCSQSDVCVV